MISAAIGFQVNLVGATSSAYSVYSHYPFNSTSHPQMLAYYWTPDFNDAADYVGIPYPLTFADGFSNSTITGLITNSSNTTNQTLRAQLLSEITVDLMAQAPEVWTFQSVGFSVSTSNVQGLLYSPLLADYGFIWSTVWLSEIRSPWEKKSRHIVLDLKRLKVPRRGCTPGMPFALPPAFLESQ